MNQTIAFIQARCSSSRFPNKVLSPLAGTTMIEFMVARARRAQRVDSVVVLTSTDTSDDLLVATLERAGIPFHRGSLEDVLARFVSASAHFPAKTYIRLTGDCPLVDPTLIDAVVAGLAENEVAYASNVDPPTFPDGLDIECFSADALATTDRMAKRGPEREHVTLWMRSEASGFKRWSLCAPCNMSSIRWTVDYADDLGVVQSIVAALPNPFEADLYDCLRALAGHPHLSNLNHHQRNEGLALSLEREAHINTVTQHQHV